MANAQQGRLLCAQPQRMVRDLPQGLAPGRAYSLRRTRNKWINGTVLHFHFLQGSDWDWPEAQKQVVRGAFSAWKALGIGLSFAEVSVPSEAELLIGRRDGKSWSFVGTEVLKNRDDGRNMNFGWDLTDQWGGATALHEVGHALGLEHEHQSPLSGIVWNEEAVYAHFKARNGWDDAEIQHNVLAKLPSNDVEGSNWDPTSIMHYPFEPGLLKLPKPYDKHGIGENVRLSVNDAGWARHWYPTTAKAAAISPLHDVPLPGAAGAQADFSFTPDATHDYTVATIGPADSRLVVFEERGGELRHFAAADDSGTEENLSIERKFVAGRNYRLSVRVAHTDGHRPIGLLLH